MTNPMRTLMRIIEDNSITIDSGSLGHLVTKMHHSPQDFDDGDLLNRIYRYETYTLKRLRLAALDATEWSIDDALVADYAARTEPAPPIIYDRLGRSIIDGTHRVNAAIRRGEKFILAYVGNKVDPYWSADQNNDD